MLVLVGASIAILGVDWSIRVDSEKNLHYQIATFANLSSYIVIESANSIGNAEDLREYIDTTHFNTKKNTIKCLRECYPESTFLPICG
jgi:hypothetical protein